jgi:hypothetical protein
MTKIDATKETESEWIPGHLMLSWICKKNKLRCRKI